MKVPSVPRFGKICGISATPLIFRAGFVYGASTARHYPAANLGTNGAAAMIDNFALGLSHGLMLLAAFLLLRRDDLDEETSPAETPRRPAETEAPAKRRFGWRA